VGKRNIGQEDIGQSGAREGGYAMKTYSVHYWSKKHHFEAKLLRGEV
jgi:hypothetical protein